MKGCLVSVQGSSYRISSCRMAIILDVALMSGQRVSLEADLTASVQSLAERAQRALGVGRGRLFGSSGSVLDGDTQLNRRLFDSASGHRPHT